MGFLGPGSGWGREAAASSAREAELSRGHPECATISCWDSWEGQGAGVLGWHLLATHRAAGVSVGQSPSGSCVARAKGGWPGPCLRVPSF